MDVERFMLADAVRRGEMPEGVFRDWLIEHTDEDTVNGSITISYLGWLHGGADHVASDPIAYVSFSDREPYEFENGDVAWCNWTSNIVDPDPADKSELPSTWLRYLRGKVVQYQDNTLWLFVILRNAGKQAEALTYVGYTTRQDAIDDLSRAAVAWARDVALQRMGVHLAC